MKTNSVSSKLRFLIVVTLLITGFSTTAVVAQVERPGASSPAERRLPPLPEWPIIGPILSGLGLIRPTRRAADPDPSLPEYRIRTLQDIDALEEIEPGERVRIIASDEDLNQLIRDILEANDLGSARAVLAFEPGLISVDIQASEDLLAKTGAELPQQVEGDLDLSAALTLEADNCEPRVRFERIQLNRWTFGLRLLAQRAINERLPEIWPQTICVERVLLMSGDLAVEGCRK